MCDVGLGESAFSQPFVSSIAVAQVKISLKMN